MNKFSFLTWVGLLVFPMVANSSALVIKDEARRTLKVIARLVYSGSALTPEIADMATNEIKSMWNENSSEVLLHGESYKVEFHIDYVLGNLEKLKRKK